MGLTSFVFCSFALLHWFFIFFFFFTFFLFSTMKKKKQARFEKTQTAQ